MHKETRRLFKFLLESGFSGWAGNNGLLTIRIPTSVWALLVKIDSSGGFEVFILVINDDTYQVLDQIMVDKYKSASEKGLAGHQHKKDVDLVKRLYIKASETSDAAYANLVSSVVD